MKTYFYYKVLRRTIIQFLDLFNDIKIVRYNRDGSFDKYVTVPIKLSGKEKVWHWLDQEKRYEQMLPMMTAWMTAIDFASDRKVNSSYDVCLSTDSNNLTRTISSPPVPYNINFNVTIWTLHMVDMDQILEQIFPYFDPYVMIRINIEEIDFTFESKVIFQSATPEVSQEIPDVDYRLIQYTLDFQVQTFFLKPTSSASIINNILAQYSTSEEQLAYNLSSTATSSSTISASPPSGGIRDLIIGWTNDDGDIMYKYERFE